MWNEVGKLGKAAAKQEAPIKQISDRPARRIGFYLECTCTCLGAGFSALKAHKVKHGHFSVPASAKYAGKSLAAWRITKEASTS